MNEQNKKDQLTNHEYMLLLQHDNFKHDNMTTINTELETYIRDESHNEYEGSKTPIERTSSASPKSIEKPQWDQYYQDGAKKLQVAEKIFHIELSLSAKKKRNGRRSLNLDIFLEPSTRPLKYIAHMVPYERKYEVFSKLSDSQLKWDKWDKIKQMYTDHKDDTVMYGKCQHRVRNTKYLSRLTVPHTAAGIIEQNGKFIAHVLLFGNEYYIELEDYPEQTTKKGAQHYYIARGSYQSAEWEEAEEMDMNL
jgi:hypothetical protein